jgi:hypothetical protein
LYTGPNANGKNQVQKIKQSCKEEEEEEKKEEVLV